MTYRSPEGPLVERIAQLDDELRAARDLEAKVIAEHAAISGEIAALTQRLRVSGPGGAARGPFFDRIHVLVWSLCAIAAMLIPAEVYIGGYVRRQPEETVVPILLLAGPGALAALIAWPYRHVPHYRRGALAGALLAACALANVALGAFR